MAKLSTQRIRQDLIDNHLSQDENFVKHIAAEMDKELVRIYKDLFGFSEAQVNENLKYTRRSPINIINQYYYMRDDKWLREQHRLNSKRKK